MNQKLLNIFNTYIIELILFIITSGMVYTTYDKWKPLFFIGDDLSTLFAYKRGFIASGFINVVSGIEHYGDKYRPIYILLYYIQFNLFHEDIYKYFVCNVILVSLNIWILSKIIRRVVSGLSWDIFLIMLTLFSTSRFLLFHITQVTGIVEISSQFLILLSLYLVVDEKNTLGKSKNISLSNGIWAVILCLGSVLIHERYLVTFIVLCFMFLKRAKRANQHRNILIIISSGSLLISLFGRSWIAGLPTFIGTGGQHLSINLFDILYNSAQAVLSILGINWGPEYLIGASFLQIGYYAYLHILIIIGMIISLFFYRRALIKNGFPSEIFELMFLGVIILIPPILTIRMEQRWEYFPFITFIVSLVIAASMIGKPFFWWLLRAYFVSHLIVNYLYMNHFENIYMMYASNIAAKFHAFIVSDSENSLKNIYLISEKEHCEWTFMNQDFALLYVNHTVNIKCISPREIDNISELSAEFLILDKHKKFVVLKKDVINEYKKYIIPLQPGNVYQIRIPDEGTIIK